MSNSAGASSSQRQRLFRLAACSLLIIFAVFVVGAYAGRWAVKNQISARLRAAIAEISSSTAEPTLDADAEWRPKATHLVRLETTVIHLSNSEGWGGGMQALDDGRIFYATRAGEFGVLGNDGIARAQPFTVDLNLQALLRHPVHALNNFNPMWFRVTDIDLWRVAEGRYELLVGHHYFDSDNQCVQLRLSRAEVGEVGGGWALLRPFETLFEAAPCITFYEADYKFAFEGHFSGGRIARLADGRILFTTGDHGWVGLRGYPAVSAEDSSTLGKVLLIDLATKAVEIYAKGVRNPQGLHVDSHGRIWETEHGPRGGDELNVIERGQDFGWPFATYGTDYGPVPWPHNAIQGRPDGGRPPQYAWVPSIGVSNLIEVRGDEFELWKGDLLVLSLTGQAIHRLRLDGTRVVYDEPINFDGMRLRDIVEFSDGRVALLTDAGQIVLIRNADRKGGTPFLDVAHQQSRTADLPIEAREHAVAGRYAGSPDMGEDLPMTAADTRSAGMDVFVTHCSGCHSLREGDVGVGPSLSGVIGRKAGSTDFAYSEDLAQSGDTWTSRRIVEFALQPSAMYSNSAMAAVSMTQEQQRDLESFFDRGMD